MREGVREGVREGGREGGIEQCLHIPGTTRCAQTNLPQALVSLGCNAQPVCCGTRNREISTGRSTGSKIIEALD